MTARELAALLLRTAALVLKVTAILGFIASAAVGAIVIAKWFDAEVDRPVYVFTFLSVLLPAVAAYLAAIYFRRRADKITAITVDETPRSPTSALAPLLVAVVAAYGAFRLAQVLRDLCILRLRMRAFFEYNAEFDLGYGEDYDDYGAYDAWQTTLFTEHGFDFAVAVLCLCAPRLIVQIVRFAQGARPAVEDERQPEAAAPLKS